ncbi:MAG: alpha-L-fucosidase, partial [Betaproteobacteria bacterium]|nr:alpha-L-fucosidase [Betaproteobacteria bacterium]
VAQAKGADKSGIIHPVSVGSGQLQSDPEGPVVAVQQDGYRKDRSFDSVDPGKVEPFAPTEADKQAYADMKFAMKLNFGLINFSEQKGTGYGGGANPLFTGAPNSDTWQSAPADEATWAGFDISSDNIAKSMTLPSNLFRAPYQTQAEFKHKVSDNWARRAKESGARYIAFITRHHAGWASWDSKYTTYDIGTSSSPNIDIPQAVIDSAIDFDLKVVLWWSAIDRVHYFQQNPGGENYQQGSSNDNDEYFDFAKNQIQELLEKDPTGDTIVGFWYDLAEYKAHIGRHRLLDWKRHVQRLRPGVIQMFNQREDLGDILNIEATATFDHLARKPTSYGEPWEFEDRAVDEVRPVASLDNGKLDLEPNIANEVYKAVDTNGLFLLNIPAARDGLFGPHANAALQEGGRLLNGGGRVDGFHLDWEYSFINGDKNQPEWSRYNNDGNADNSWLGTVNHATRAGAYADYKFFGKSVKVYVKTQPSNGDLNIYIDGIFRRKFRSGIAADGSVLAYSTNALSYGEHVIRIEVGEEVESGANDGKVELDFIEVAPRIWKILVDSFAGADNQYATGDNIDVRVYFNDYVKVSGTPQLEINVGGVARMANYVSGSGTRSMIFRYTVVAGDTASGGISVEANKLKLNGGTIMVDDGGAAVTTDADLNHDPMAADAQHQVAGTTISGLMTGGNDRLV